MVTRARARGWTLVELIVVLLISAIFLGTASSALVLGQSFWTAGATQVVLNSELRYALEVITRELTDAGGSTLLFGGRVDSQGWYEEVRFQVPRDGSDPEEGPNPPTSTLAEESTIFWGNSSDLEWSPVITYRLDRGRSELIREEGGIERVLARRVADAGFRLQPYSSPALVEIRVAFSGGSNLSKVKAALGKWDPTRGDWVGMPRIRLRN